MKCKTCNGTGAVESDGGKFTCPDCAGSGVHQWTAAEARKELADREQFGGPWVMIEGDDDLIMSIAYPALWLKHQPKLDSIKTAVDGLVAHASKQTSPRVSKLAGEYLRLGRDGLATRLLAARPDSMDEMVEGFLAIFASALSQDEQK